jgi:hypothetical protein
MLAGWSMLLALTALLAIFLAIKLMPIILTTELAIELPEKNPTTSDKKLIRLVLQS